MCTTARMSIQRLSPLGSTMRHSRLSMRRVFSDSSTAALTLSTSSGWTMGQTTSEASAKLNSCWISSWNSGEHQKVRCRKSVSNTPARAASSARPSRSAFTWASWRASWAASRSRLRASTSSTRPQIFSGRPSASRVISAWTWTQRVSPVGSRMRMSSGPAATCVSARKAWVSSRTLCTSAGWVIGQTSAVASSKVSPRPMTSTNSGALQKVRATKSVSNTPARAAFRATFSRSPVTSASCRAPARTVMSRPWTT